VRARCIGIDHEEVQQTEGFIEAKLGSRSAWKSPDFTLAALSPCKTRSMLVSVSIHDLNSIKKRTDGNALVRCGGKSKK